MTLSFHTAFAFAALALAPAGPLPAQGSYRPSDEMMLRNAPYDGRFVLARIGFVTQAGGYYYRRLPAWAHGYPSAELNLSQILKTLSTVQVRLNGTNVLAADDPELFHYPVAYMAEADFWNPTAKEAAALHKYLEKGGFLIFDDFRDPGRFGGTGWAGFADAMRRVLPGAKMIDMDPRDPIFHSFYEINSLTIIPQAYDGGHAILRGIYENNDPTRRLLAIINFNTDVSEYWEFSGTGTMLISESNEAYKLGVNYLVYALTH